VVRKSGPCKPICRLPLMAANGSRDFFARYRVLAAARLGLFSDPEDAASYRDMYS
jgi:hypothetical protein